MSANGTRGSYRTTKANQMRAFDKLPREVREALANSVDNWVSQPFHTMHRRDGHEPAYIAWWIGVINARELAKRERERARASGVYKGNEPDSSITGRPRCGAVTAAQAD